MYLSYAWPSCASLQVSIGQTGSTPVQEELRSVQEKLQALEEKTQQLRAEKASQEERAQMAGKKHEEIQRGYQAHLDLILPFKMLVELQQVSLASMNLTVNASRSAHVMVLDLGPCKLHRRSCQALWHEAAQS